MSKRKTIEDLKKELREVAKQRCETCISWTTLFNPKNTDPRYHPTFSCCLRLPMDQYCKEYFEASRFTISCLEEELDETSEHSLS